MAERRREKNRVSTTRRVHYGAAPGGFPISRAVRAGDFVITSAFGDHAFRPEDVLYDRDGFVISDGSDVRQRSFADEVRGTIRTVEDALGLAGCTLSDVVDASTARVLKTAVSDGIIAPGYEPEALEILKAKKKGAFVVMKADPTFAPPARESRDLFGMRMVQDRNALKLTEQQLQNVALGSLTPEAKAYAFGYIRENTTVEQNMVEFVSSGDIIADVGAGPMRAAIGVSFRTEELLNLGAEELSPAWSR